MTIVTNRIDGDTFETEEGRRVRLANVNTQESVHSDSDKNTAAGEAASEFTKDVVSSGDVKTSHDYGVDHYGRNVSNVTKRINDTDIDLGLVLLDQGYSTYQTRFGEAKDPALHDAYKEYFAKNSPYQYGDFRQPMSREDYAAISTAHTAFTETYAKFKDGDATQEEFDQATYELYKDPQKVAHFRHMQAGWGQQLNSETMGSSDKESILFMLQSSPEAAEQYNRAVRNSHLSVMRAPEQEKSFWEKVDVSFSQMNSISNTHDTLELNYARQNRQEYDVPDTMLTSGLDPRFHTTIFEEVDKYGEAAGLALRDQLTQDIENKTVMDNMEWYAQIGYGGLAMLADPLAIIPAAPLAKGTQATIQGVRMYQLGNAIQGTRMWTQGRLFENVAKGVTYAGAGALETGIHSLPMLSGDHTYTARDYGMDLMVGGVFGTVLGGAIDTGAYTLQVRDANRKAVRELDKHIKNPEAPKHGSEELQQKEVETVNAGKSQEQVHNWTKGTGKKQAQEGFTPWAAISQVSTEGYQSAARKIRNLFPDDSSMKVLINQQVGLNNKRLTPETTEVAQEINSEILHLASVYPDGKVPPLVLKEIGGVSHTQKDVKTVNVLDQILQGKTTDTVGMMTKYLERIEKLQSVKDLDAKPVSRTDFLNEFSDLLKPKKAIDGDVVELTQSVPRELSYIKDVLELNRIAEKSDNLDLLEQVEKLNGIVVARLRTTDNAEAPDILTQKTKSFGKKVKLSGPEIVARLKAKGLKPKTPEWKAAFAKLRGGEVEVAPEVNQVGKLDKAVTGRNVTEADPDSPDYHNITDAKIRLSELQKLPNPDKDQIAEATALRDQIENANSERTQTLEAEVNEADLLPRDIFVTDTVSAYKNPTVENLTKLRNKLRSINKKNGSTVVTGKKERTKQVKRLNAVKARLKKNKKVTIQRMLDNGNFADLIDVIRVSHTLAKKKKAEPVKVDTKQVDKPDAKTEIAENIQKWERAVHAAKLRLDEAQKSGNSKAVTEEGENLARLEAIHKEALLDADEIDLTKPVTEEEIDTLINTPELLSSTEKADIGARVDAAVDEVLDETGDKISNGLAEFVRSGEKKRFELAAKPTGPIDYVGRMLTKMTKSVGEIFIDSNLTSFKYFGAKVTEIGRGFGGNAKRAPTAATIRDATFKESVVKLIPQYRKQIDAYATSKGKGALGRLKARERSGQTDPLVNEFNREVFVVQEMRRQGKPIPKSIDKSVVDFVDQWDYYMGHNHDVLVDAGAAGFTKDRKVKNYIPHVWQTGKFTGAITKYGRPKVVALLSKAYRNLASDSKPVSKELADKQANDLIDNVISDDYSLVDQYSPTMDSRAKARRDLDTTAELDGLSVLDLLDTDVVGLGARYSNRVGGWVGLAKATDGLITSQKDIDVFKANMLEEAKEAGIKPDRHIQMFEDTIDQLFGRPTKNMLTDTKGLPPELRELKDLAALTKMGGLGTAQLAETGQIITRNVLNTFSDPSTAKKVLSMGADGKSDRLLMEEIQSISNITEDLEFLDRQTVHLDQTVLDEVGKVRKLSLKIANLATGGELKAEASRGLGKLSGYNMIRRAQSRVTQASFMLDIANHFTKGTGVMGNARMADVGLTDTLGKNDAMEAAFKKYAEFDENGVLSKLNIDKWDKSLREELQYTIIRDEAQQIQRTHVGELPPWMNKPIMGLIFQFRQMPIVANSKSLGRALAFADKEAVTGVLLNSAIAGLVRYSKFALLGTATAAAVGKFGETPDVSEDQTQVHKYISQFGIFPDLHDLAYGRSGINSISDVESGWDFMQSQVPVLGLMNDYYEAGNAGVKGDIRGLVNSAENLVPLSNTAIGEVMQAAIQPQIDKLPTNVSFNPISSAHSSTLSNVTPTKVRTPTATTQSAKLKRDVAPLLHALEGSVTTANVPNVAGGSNSGVTIAGGLDLGQYSVADLRGNLKLGETLVDKLKPYVGVRGKAAQQRIDKLGDLTITKAEAAEIDSAVFDFEKKKLTNNFKTVIGRDFNKEPKNVQEALIIAAYNLGSSPTAKTSLFSYKGKMSNFAKQIKAKDYKAAAKNLSTWTRKAAVGLQKRRRTEGDLLAGRITSKQFIDRLNVNLANIKVGK
tara:strand:- start:10477 stop:16779 length:6303 start_codon:yes stop_codon:yes gene_type:complete